LPINSKIEIFDMHAVSMTPYARCRGVIDKACTVHAVSLTLHVKWNFRTTLKIEIQRRNGFNMQKNKKCIRSQWHRMQNMTLHAHCTIYEQFEQPLQPSKGIHIKKIDFCKLSYPTTTTICKFKGATHQEQFFVHAMLLTPHARFFHSKIDHI
jgi:hypothetical protein